MSSAVILGDSRFTLSTNRNSALCFWSSAELSKSRCTSQTSSSLPKSSAATAGWDFTQKGQSFLKDV